MPTPEKAVLDPPGTQFRILLTGDVADALYRYPTGEFLLQLRGSGCVCIRHHSFIEVISEGDTEFDWNFERPDLYRQLFPTWRSWNGAPLEYNPFPPPIISISMALALLSDRAEQSELDLPF